MLEAKTADGGSLRIQMEDPGLQKPRNGGWQWLVLASKVEVFIPSLAAYLQMLLNSHNSA